MVQIKFGSFKLGTSPPGFKIIESSILNEYLLFSRYPYLSGVLFSSGEEGKKPKTELPTLDGWAFSVSLLGGYPPPQNTPKSIALDWEKLSSLKADAIEKTGNNYTIYEIKDTASSGSLGQLLTYKWLFEEVLLYPKNTSLVLVCNFIIPGLVQPLLSNGVRIHSKTNSWSIPQNFRASDIRAASLNYIPIN